MYRFLIALFCIVSVCSTGANSPQNIVFILADDLGWNDTGIFQQSQFIETPNIDALASRGMVFSNAYTNSPLCSPTRASILTGQTPAKHGSTTPNHHLPTVNLQAYLPRSGPSNKKSLIPVSVTRLDTALPTLSSILKENNYQTAHFGKWHLGASPYSPLEHGFDTDIPHFNGAGPVGGFLAPWRFAPNLQPQVPGEHIDVRLAQEAGEWIMSVKDSGPFFLNFWAFSVHAPFNADPELVEYFKTRRTPFHSQRSATYAAMVKHFDDAVGILWESLVEANVQDNTIIVFTSDNGGNMYDVLGQVYATSNFPLRGGKATVYDGGIRVPTAIIWPGLTQSNTLNSAPIQSADFFPTLLKGMSLTWPASHEIDGSDIRPLLSGQTAEVRPIFTFYPAQPQVPDWLPPSATVMKDKWKLIRTFHYGENGGHYYQLFDLSSDPSEAKNLVDERPDLVLELDTLLENHLTGSEAVVPKVNPNYRAGSFSYDSLGVPRDTYRLPEDNLQGNLQIKLNSDISIADANDEVNISYELINASNAANVQFQQFMGSTVALVQSKNTISFVAPSVSQEEYVSFAFILNDGNRTVRKQIGVLVKPSPKAPSLSVTQISQQVIKGSTVTFDINAVDGNKDFIMMSIKSDDLAVTTLEKPPTDGLYNLSIPYDYSHSSASIVFTADDGQLQTSQSVTFDVSSAPLIIEEDNTNSGGGSTSMLTLLLLSLLAIFKKISLINSCRKRVKSQTFFCLRLFPKSNFFRSVRKYLPIWCYKKQ
ncbi:MAG: arylsulfatase A-like enzyme [Paraglaciecola sp.]|jgi:arylsulfatase A-like enzyme